MQPRARHTYAERASHDRWLVSYTDVLTILLALFVAAAAQNLQSHLAPKPPAPPPAEPRSSHRKLAQVEQKLQQHGLDLRLDDRGLTISLPQTILFPSGEDRVMPGALPIISQIAEQLSSVPNKVVLVGHADSVPIHNRKFQSNWELSSARSLSLLALLTTQFGISESRLSVQSYGSNRPKESNDTAAGRAENRRVEILVLDENGP